MSTHVRSSISLSWSVMFWGFSFNQDVLDVDIDKDALNA